MLLHGPAWLSELGKGIKIVILIKDPMLPRLPYNRQILGFLESHAVLSINRLQCLHDTRNGIASEQAVGPFDTGPAILRFSVLKY